MSLSELLEMFRVHWRLVVGSLAIALACAAAYLAWNPAEYEASATIALGQVGTGQEDWLTVPVESEEDALRRMGNPEFVNAVIRSLDWRDVNRVRLVRDSYRVTRIDSQQLRITVRGLTSDDSTRAAAAFVDVIAGMHQELLEAASVRRGKQLVVVRAEISDTEAWLNRLDALVLKQAKLDSAAATLCFLGPERQERERLRALKSQEGELLLANLAEFNKPTRAVSLLVLEQPVQPNVHRVLFFSAFVGILVGVFLVTVVAIRRISLGIASSTADR